MEVSSRSGGSQEPESELLQEEWAKGPEAHYSPSGPGQQKWEAAQFHHLPWWESSICLSLKVASARFTLGHPGSQSGTTVCDLGQVTPFSVLG